MCMNSNKQPDSMLPSYKREFYTLLIGHKRNWPLTIDFLNEGKINQRKVEDDGKEDRGKNKQKGNRIRSGADYLEKELNL